MRVLVTGAAGYVGGAVVGALGAAGHEVVALVRTPGAGFDDAVTVRVADVLDEAALGKAVADVDAVCHLAALSRVREAAADPLRCYRVNLVGTLNLLAALPDRARLVYASTGSVYGTPTRAPIGEDSPLLPANPYAASKAAAEGAIAAQAATGALGAVTLRIFNAAGAVAGRPDPDLSRIIPRVVAVARGAGRLTVNGDGGAVRDFVHVSDIARAFGLALDAARPGRHAVYNLGAVPASVREIIAETERLTGLPVPVEFGPAYPGEARELRADTTLIRAELGWRPAVTSLASLVGDQVLGQMGDR